MDVKVKATISALANRFKEPSSWAGLTGVLGLVGLHVDPGVVQDIAYIGVGLSGLVAFFLPESK